MTRSTTFAQLRRYGATSDGRIGQTTQLYLTVPVIVESTTPRPCTLDVFVAVS